MSRITPAQFPPRRFTVVVIERAGARLYADFNGQWIGRERTSYECALADAVLANADPEVVGLAGEAAA